MIEQDLYKKMSTSEVKNVLDNDMMDFVLNLELLNGCAHHCTGCFVNRKNDITDIDIEKAYELASDLSTRGLRFREIIISPTDIFSATNSEEILRNKTFQKLLKLHYKTRITTTAMFENTPLAEIERIFKILDNPAYFKSDMIMEFLVPLNVEKILSGDEEYFTHHMKVIEFFKTKTPKMVDWSFVINVHYDQLLLDNFEKVTAIVRDKFDGIIEFLPSFFRTGNDSLIEQHLEDWDILLRESVNSDNYKDIMLTIADEHHNGFNTIVLNYKNQQMYISPFVYEQILLREDDLKISDISSDAVFKQITDLTIKQFGYAEQTSGCSSCEYLNTCVGRNVLSFMEAKGITDCVYPKDILNLFLDNSLSPRIERCLEEEHPIEQREVC